MDPDDQEAQMHQMMGFASFGNKPKHGKNRDIAPKAPGTSSNLTPLGHRATAEDSNKYTSKDSQILQSGDMGVHEQELDEESSKWVAARLPNPAPKDSRENSDSDLNTTATSSTPIPQTPSTLPLQYPLPNPPHHLNVAAIPFEPHPKANPILDTDSASDTTTIKPTSTTAVTSTSTYTPNDIRSDPTYWTSTSDKQTWENTIGYTSPWTGAEFTRKELREYAVGKEIAKADGSVVLAYFKPSFVEGDPWERWVGMQDEDGGGGGGGGEIEG